MMYNKAMVIAKDVIRVVILGFVLSFFVYSVFAQTGSWTEPTADPPGNNRPAPLVLDQQGNLNLPGSLDVVGNLELSGNIDVGGLLKFTLSQIKLSPQLVNGPEDIYPGNQGWVWYTAGDTCNGDMNGAYSCSITESRSCWDLWDVCVCCPSCGYRASRTITCNLGVGWQRQ